MIRVDISTLRIALGLPQHNTFHQGIYTQYEHPTLEAHDNIDDVDHNDDVGESL